MAGNKPCLLSPCPTLLLGRQAAALKLCGLDVVLLQFHLQGSVAARAPYRLDDGFHIRYFQPVVDGTRASRPSLPESSLDLKPLLAPLVDHSLIHHDCLLYFAGCPP